MSLEDFVSGGLSDSYAKFESLKKQFIAEGIDPRVAEYKANAFLKPEKLEKINLMAENEECLRPNMMFVLDSKEELELVTKYFDCNLTIKQVRDSSLLIKFLRLLEELDDGSIEEVV